MTGLHDGGRASRDAGDAAKGRVTAYGTHEGRLGTLAFRQLCEVDGFRVGGRTEVAAPLPVAPRAP